MNILKVYDMGEKAHQRYFIFIDEIGLRIEDYDTGNVDFKGHKCLVLSNNPHGSYDGLLWKAINPDDHEGEEIKFSELPLFIQQVAVHQGIKAPIKVPPFNYNPNQPPRIVNSSDPNYHPEDDAISNVTMRKAPEPPKVGSRAWHLADMYY